MIYYEFILKRLMDPDQDCLTILAKNDFLRVILQTLRSVYTNVRLVAVNCLYQLITRMDPDFCSEIKQRSNIVSIVLILQAKQENVKCVCLEFLAEYCRKSRERLESMFGAFPVAEIIHNSLKVMKNKNFSQRFEAAIEIIENS